MVQIANWIWDGSGEFEKNVWLCFRRAFVAGDITSAVLRISADSRYTLYLNGSRIGRGPCRYWPFAVEYDTYDVAHLLCGGENVIAVEVNHYGTSTSQYIHQPGGLFLQLDMTYASGRTETLCSDEGFRCIRCAAFSAETSRVNVSQPYVEAYDARLMDANWIRAGYDDSAWQPCVAAQDASEKKAGMIPRDIPPLTQSKRHARAVIRKQRVKARGTGVTVDFGRAFYPGDTSTADKLQTGYIVTVITSPRDMECAFSLVSRMWPFREERFSVNGEVAVLAVDQKQARLRLREGSNLFMLDVSGAYQRFYIDLHFDSEELAFRVPETGSGFIAVGPFDYAEIGNIVCAEGFHINREDARYQAAIHMRDMEELGGFREYIHPVAEEDIDTANIKTLAGYCDVVEKLAVLPKDQNMVIANSAFAAIEAAPSDTEFVVDFGAEVSGFVCVDVDAVPGTVIDIIGFEYMGESPEIPDDLNNSMRYIAGGGRASYQFHRRAGFRYLLLTVRASASLCRIYEVSVEESSFAVAEAGSFRCSDERLNRIWEISKDTLRLCMEDVFVDCPGFEQAFWIGDARSTALYQYYVYGSGDIVKRSLLMAGRSLHRSPLPECHVPAGVSLVLPAWALFWAIAASDYHQYIHDPEFEQQIYPYIRNALDAFIGHLNADGLLEIDAWNMLDWSDMDTPYRGVVTHQNGLLAHVLRLTADMAGRVGDDETRRRYVQTARAVAQAVNRHLWSEQRQAYVDCTRSGVQSSIVSQLTQAVLLLGGCVPKERRKAALRLFDDPPEDVVGIGTPFACFFLYEVMASRGRYRCIVGDIRHRWGEMLEYGATTCWETFIGFYKERLTRSYCHAWSSVPCYMFGRYILGVVPTAPGFARVRIKPHACGLKWARGTVPTPHGVISVSWKRINGKMQLEYDAPASVEVEA